MAAMRRAVEATRTRDPGEATRIIQAALAGGRRPPPRRRRRRCPAAAAARSARGGGRARGAAPRGSRRSGCASRCARRCARCARDGGRSGRCRAAEPAAARRRYRRGRGSRRAALPARRGRGTIGSMCPSPGRRPVRGLVLMLHGCKQNPDDFATGTGMNALAETHRLIVAYPGQTAADNMSACWNWFRPGDQRRDAGEPAILAGLARALAEEFGIEPGPGLRRRAVGGRGHGGGAGRELSGCLRRHRRPLGPARRCGQRRALGLRGDARRAGPCGPRRRRARGRG